VRRHLTRFALTFTAATFLPASSVSAQLPDPPIRPAPSGLWQRATRVPEPLPVRVGSSEESDHTVLGLVVGGGLGFVAGWGFYNTICEAVDNNCSNSRMPYLVIGTGLGASLGALIGSVAD
jgi:ABC-type nitrate/sulfonate/bicarbonate transport system permease component